MVSRVAECHGIRLAQLGTDGPPLATERDALDVIAAAAEHHADMILIPAECLGHDFFTLRTGTAGQILQKFNNYRLRVAIVGDVSERVQASSAMQAFMLECNRGSNVWFVKDFEQLEDRLRSLGPAGSEPT
jgi:hypothetical protein